MTCSGDEPELLPYDPTPEHPDIGRLKRQIACLRSELECYRQLCPGRRYSQSTGILVDEEFYDED